MKNNYLFIIYFLLMINSPLYCQNWLWAKGTGGANNDNGVSVECDKYGNVYQIGIFESNSINFGNYTLNNIGINKQSFFIAKYDSNGNVIWAKSPPGFGLYSHSGGLGIAVDNNRNFYVTGNFISDSIVFDNIILKNDSTPFTDNFLVKYDSSGSVLWAKKGMGCKQYDESFSLSIDPFDNIYIIGSFMSDSICFGNTTLTRNLIDGITGNFIVKYDSSGNILWAQNLHGRVVQIYDITKDDSGNIIIGGTFNCDSMIFSNVTLYQPINDSADFDIFIAKYDSFGNALWARSAGGNKGEQLRAISTDATGNIYITGAFDSDSLRFGNFTLFNDSVGNYLDVFIAKYNSSGNVIWAQSIGGNQGDIGEDIAAYPNGDFYISGQFNSNTISFGNFSFSRASYTDLFYVRYDSSGAVKKAVQVTGTQNGSFLDAGNSVGSIAVSKTNENVLYTTGTMSGVTLPLGNFILTNSLMSTNDAFIASLNDFPTGISNPSFDDGNIFAFPNPFSSSTTITFKNRLPNENFEFRMTDVCGREVNRFSFRNQQSITINRNDLSPGVYIYTLSDHKDFYRSGKLVIQ